MIDLLNKIRGWLAFLADFAVTLLVVLLVVDILFPGSTNVMSNLGAQAAGFGPGGQAAIVGVLLFLLLYRYLPSPRKPPGADS